MSDQNSGSRSQWATNLGFILAAAGSAVGLGNIWRFPFLMGSNGGFGFLIVYLAFILLLGIPIMIGELAIGRHTMLSPVSAYEKIKKGSGFIGVLAILAPFIIMTYYGIVGGWAMKYMVGYLTTGIGTNFISLITGQLGLGIWQPILWNVAFLAICWVVCIFGVKGIERASKIMMPALFVILIIIIIRSLTLPGAGAGLAFMFANVGGFTIRAIPAAMGQVFFSMSLAMGAMITYGSYLKKEEKIPGATLKIAGLDTGIAILAGFAIFPAVFAMGANPGAGAGLAFITLPSVFEAMPFGGAIIGFLFFTLLLFAALTSAISLVEACSSFCIDTFKMDRKVAVTVLCVLFCILAMPNAMSQGGYAFNLPRPILGMGDLFDLVDFISNNIILPIGGLLMCIVVGWFWKPENAIAEIEATPNYVFQFKKAWIFLIKFVTPILAFIVLVWQFIG